MRGRGARPIINTKQVTKKKNPKFLKFDHFCRHQKVNLSKIFYLFTNQTSVNVKQQLKVKIFPYVLDSKQLFYGGIIIIIFVDFLKVGSVDEAVC